MNMKLVKYMLIAILVLGTGEVAAQVQVVSGKVTEMLGNQIEPIVGANVNIVNAQNRSVGGAVTNLDGDYRLQIPAQENNLTLVYSYIGMKTKRIKYTGQKVLNVKLESNVETLDEVAITAKRIERNNMGIGHKENVCDPESDDGRFDCYCSDSYGRRSFTGAVEWCRYCIEC